MSQSEVTGSLASGGRFRATSYMVELTDAVGELSATFDVNDLSGIQRNGQTVILKRTGNSDITITTSSLDDAGRLEQMLRASLPSATAAVVSAPSGGGLAKVFKWGCLGSLGIIGLIVVIAVIAAIAGGGNTNTDDDAETAANVSTTPESLVTDEPAVSTEAAEEMATIGETIALIDDGWNLTVTDVRKTSSTEFLFDEKRALGVYVIVDLMMENTGNEKHALSGQRFTLVDDRGRTYEWYGEGSIGYGMQELGSDINPGLSAPATILFDVPTDATGLVLQSLGEFEVALGNVQDIPAE
ncbi:hypothetical protein BH23CHL1_BH23CHL1_26320 [soil metagenome]